MALNSTDPNIIIDHLKLEFKLLLAEYGSVSQENGFEYYNAPGRSNLVRI